MAKELGMRAKGLRDLPDEMIDSGMAHRVQLQGRFERLIVDPSAETVDAEKMLCVAGAGGAVINAVFKDKIASASKHEVFPDKIISANRSAHGVGFGRLVGRRSDKACGIGEVLQVAMKPFSNPETAVNEVLGYWALHEQNIETFSPIGIFPAEAPDVSVVMTRKRNDLQSLDRDDWIVGRQVFSEDDVETLDRNTRTIQEIAQTLAWLHGHGIFHKDGQIKNYAVANSGTIGVIDTENLSRKELHSVDTVGFAIEDIEKLLKSLILNDNSGKIFGVGLFANMANEDMRSSYEELVKGPYKDALWRGFYEEEIDADQAQLLMDGIEHHFSTSERSNWPACLVSAQA